MPSDKKRRKTIFDVMFGDFFGEDIFGETDELFGGLKNAGSGYSLQISQVNGETVVTVKAYGQVDRKALEKKLKEKYPDARINIELYDETGKRKAFIEEITSDEHNKEENRGKEPMFISQKSNFDFLGSPHHAMIEEIKSDENKKKDDK